MLSYGVHGWDETQYAELLEYKYDKTPRSPYKLVTSYMEVVLLKKL